MEDFGLEKRLNALSRAWWTILVGVWESVVLRTLWTLRSQLKRIQRRRILLYSPADLESIFVIY